MTDAQRKARTFLMGQHRQSCFEQGDHPDETDTPYSIGADAIARPMTAAEAATHWAITSPSGMHIGLWSSYETAKRVFYNEVNGSKLWPLRALSQGGE